MTSNYSEEKLASMSHKYSLELGFGGTEKAFIYFDVETGDEPDEWIVSDGIQLFYNTVEITELFDGYELEQKIYDQSEDVDRQIQDYIASDMEQYYLPYDD